MSQSGGFFQNGGDSQFDGSQKPDRRHYIRSLTIKQFLSCVEPSGDVKVEVDGAPLDLVRMVVIVRQISVNEKSLSLDVQDSTGDLQGAKYWFRENEEPAEPPYQVGDYVALYGTSRHMGGRHFINVVKIDSNISLSFVFFHQMCVLREHWHFTNQRPIGKGAIKADADATSDLFVPDAPAEARNTLEGRIVTALQSQGEGLHVKFLAQKLQADELAVEEVCAKLHNDGVLYDTEVNTYALSG